LLKVALLDGGGNGYLKIFRSGLPRCSLRQSQPALPVVAKFFIVRYDFPSWGVDWLRRRGFEHEGMVCSETEKSTSPIGQGSTG
jgi:hypothetical protein